MRGFASYRVMYHDRRFNVAVVPFPILDEFMDVRMSSLELAISIIHRENTNPGRVIIHRSREDEQRIRPGRGPEGSQRG